MKSNLLSAWGYQGDAMNLPVADVDASVSYYGRIMGFRVVERSDTPHKKAVLERDGIRMALAENGGDPEQPGCAFHTDNIEALRTEFVANAPTTPSAKRRHPSSGRRGAKTPSLLRQSGELKIGEIGDESRDGKKFKVFFVVAPDGLCYWFGEQL